MSSKKNATVKNLTISVLTEYKLLSAVLLVTIIGVVVVSLLPPQILKMIVDEYLCQGRSGSDLLFPAGLYFGALLFIGLLEFVKAGVLTSFGQKLTGKIRLTMMEKLSRIPVRYLTTHEAGAVSSRFTNDVDTISELFTDGIVGMIIDVFKIVGIVISIYLFSIWLGCIILLLVPVIYGITRAFQKRMLKAQISNRASVGKVNNHIPESIHNIQMIRSYCKQKYMEKRYQTYLKENYDTKEKVNFYDSIFSPIILVIRALVIAVLVILSSDQLSVLGISVGMVAAAIELISNIFNPIESLGMELQSIQQAVAGICRVNEFLAEEEDSTKNEALTAEKLMGKQHSVTISLDHVTFGYEENMPVLSDFSIQIAPYENVTFAGRTGVGKSTLFKLILGLLEPDAGQIRIGGQEAAGIPNREKRKLFGYVEQSFHFVPGTVCEQIALGDSSVTEEEVMQAMQFVGMDEYVRTLENGYQTVVADYMFSQGQRQLLSIARAIVTDPPVMLLDEMTANLDSETEQKVIEVLQKAGAKRTILSISHRLSAVLQDNRIIELKQE